MKTILTFDDFVLNRTDNTRRVFKQPDWKFEYAYTDPVCPAYTGPSCVVPAPQGGYMLLYHGIPRPDSEDRKCLMAWSPDGLQFEPYILHPDAQFPHMRGDMCDDIGMFVTLDADETDPSIRYKAPHTRFHIENGGLTESEPYLLGSADLVHWKRISDNPVVPSTVDCTPSFLRNPVTGKYQITTRRRWGERRICLVESDDLQNWTIPRAILHPSPDDEPLTHLYSMPHYYYAPGDVFIGLLWKHVMPFDRISEGPVHTEYAYSYDGIMWNRTRARLFPERSRGEYGGGCDYVFSMIDRGEDMVFYCNATLSEHHDHPKPPEGCGYQERSENQIIPGVLKKNRFVCIESGKGQAELQTQWLRLKKPELYLNAIVPFGSLKAELYNWNGPLEGFSFDDFQPILGDHTDAPLRWKGDLSRLVERGDWFILHIVFEQAEVYSISGDFDFTINLRAPAYERL